MIWFQLWREFKLSIAEILAIFPMWKIVFFDKGILLLDFLDKDFVLKKAKILWWTIKIIDFNSIKDYDNFIYEEACLIDWKFKYWVSVFWEKVNLKKILMNIKKNLRENKISSRFINKDFKNLSSAQIIWENLIKRWSDFTLIIWENTTYVWKSIWVQDIKSYSDRDYSKERDMQVGMLPPKLSQMMINLAKKTPLPTSRLTGERSNIVYDPFVWLGTILIESIYMWNTEVFWTDLSEKMVKVSNENINKLKNKFNFNHKISKLNAKFIEESEYLKESDTIITEWYLWEVMTKNNISSDRIKKQRDSLTKIYEAFFVWLKKVNFKWNIVISFPFWEIKWKHLYFNEIYDILDKYCNILDLLWDKIDLSTTKYGSLLYKRPNQLVWREIFKLTIK